ncbi:hypothetical protein M3Y95_00547200 [Aphelenchoides besseyi]|nr:hypothetical protein M3Y95_00547200 [Aphelenchoides besseyi]
MQNILVTCILFLFTNTVGSIACYECSRGDNDQQQNLIDYFFEIDDDESAQRALNHSSVWCGSNVTLDRTFRSYCEICQIAYLLHDPQLTTIASCGTSARSMIEDKLFVVNTCTKDLCNNFALNQDNETFHGDTTSRSNVNSMFILLFASLGYFLNE